MAGPITVNVRVLGLREFANAMGTMGRTAFDRSQRKAVTFIAKDYRKVKAGKVAQDIDRPNTFTRKAYDWDGAPRTGPISSRAFVRDRQSQYLDIIETGGTRRTNGHNGPMSPKPRITDRYGGLFGAKGVRKRFLDRSPSPVPGRRRGPTGVPTGTVVYRILKLRDSRTGEVLHGVFEQRKMARKGKNRRTKRSWRNRLIIRFREQSTYQPQLNFGSDARRYARDRFPALSLRLFNEELRRLQR